MGRVFLICKIEIAAEFDPNFLSAEGRKQRTKEVLHVLNRNQLKRNVRRLIEFAGSQ